MSSIFHYHVHQLVPYINWNYFFHAWGFQPRFAAVTHVHDCEACGAAWLHTFAPEERPKAREAMALFHEARQLLSQLDDDWRAGAVFRLCPANAQADDLLIDIGKTQPLIFPLLRQQTPQPGGAPFLCLADFVRPVEQGIPDHVGFFATSMYQIHKRQERNNNDNRNKELHEENDNELPDSLSSEDPYQCLLVQTLSDRLAEAAAEVLHLDVRRRLWGYAPHEALSIPQLHNEEFQGIRPAVGYPSLPDQSVNFLIDSIVDMRSIGITLTENGAMHPHASVSGLMLAHPAARYFSIGKIGSDQLASYAARRNLSIQNAQKFLAQNLD